MSNPKGINQYTKQGGSRKVPVAGTSYSIGRRAYAKILKGMRAYAGPGAPSAYVKAGANQIAAQSRSGTTSVTTRGIKTLGGWKGRV